MNSGGYHEIRNSICYRKNRSSDVIAGIAVSAVIDSMVTEKLQDGAGDEIVIAGLVSGELAVSVTRSCRPSSNRERQEQIQSMVTFVKTRLSDLQRGPSRTAQIVQFAIVQG